MIGTIDVKINAAHPNLPLAPLFVFVNSPAAPRVLNVPKKIGNWELTKVYASATFPDNTTRTVEMKNVAGCYVGTIPACEATGSSEGGFQITADGRDENGNAVTGYCLGRGDLFVLDRDGQITSAGVRYFFHFVDAVPEHPNKGDVAIIDGALKWFDGEGWSNFANVDLSPIDVQLAALQDGKADKATTYTKSEADEKFFPRVSDVESADPGILSWGGTPVDQKLILRVGTLEVPGLTVGRKNFTDKQDSINVVGILKGDGLGIISTATKSSTSSDPSNADYRDPQDNICHKTEVYWTGDYGIETGLRFTFSNFEGYLSWNDGNGHFLFTKTGETYSDFLCPEDWTGTAYVGIMGHAIESMATRHSVCTDGKKFVTSDVVDGKVSSAVSTNNPAFVSAVRNTPAPEPGQGEDPPWGTWGTVGAAIAGLVAGLKWLKDKVFDSAGNIQDQFATDLLGKQVANAKVRYALATASSATMADRTVNILTMTQSETLTFPTATTHDNKTYARDFLLKLTYTAGTMELPQGVTKVGDELSFEAGKTYLIAFTEIAADKFYVRSIDITEAQA